MQLGVLMLIILVSNVLCRRHHLHHYHLGNNTTHVEEGRSQRIAAIEADNNRSVGYTHYNKHGPGRHVCSAHKTVAQPVKTVQTFCKPTYKKYMQRCNDNQLCTGVKLVFETAYRDVYSTKNTRQLDFVCCPGWTQISKSSHGCNKPLCNLPCQNGGTCVRPDVCSCPKGFRGRQCETDIDECQELKPCDQICRNNLGSYRCDCREMFILQPDGQSCKAEEDGPAIEARDLEFETLDKRLLKLETMINDGTDGLLTKSALHDINKKVDTLTSDLKVLKNKMQDSEINHRDLRVMKSKIYSLESKANKMDEFIKYYDNTKRIAFNNKIYP